MLHQRPRGQEVDHFVRSQLLRWALGPYAQVGDPRLLLVMLSATEELVGVGAHERVLLQNAGSGQTLAATKIEVVAVAAGWQGATVRWHWWRGRPSGE